MKIKLEEFSPEIVKGISEVLSELNLSKDILHTTGICYELEKCFYETYLIGDTLESSHLNTELIKEKFLSIKKVNNITIEDIESGNVQYTSRGCSNVIDIPRVFDVDLFLRSKIPKELMMYLNGSGQKPITEIEKHFKKIKKPTLRYHLKILEEPNVRILAEKLKACIERNKRS